MKGVFLLRTFKDTELKIFEHILYLTQEQLKQFMATFLKRHYPNVIETRDYIVAEGAIPIALAAHLDTVFLYPPLDILYDRVKNVMIGINGAGFDDRAGIFAIIKLVQAGLKPHIILTTEEENGGLGAKALSSKKCPFKDLRYIIQLDRRGSNDCVFYDCDNKEFTSYIESFGFTENFGSFTDISYLCPAWKVAGVNLSVGYQNEHTAQETLYVNQLFATIGKVQKMLTQLPKTSFEYIPAPRYFSPIKPYASGLITCDSCGRQFMEEEMFPVVTQDKETVFFCPDCIVDKVSWCRICGNAYEKLCLEEPTMGICPHCEEKKYD